MRTEPPGKVARPWRRATIRHGVRPADGRQALDSQEEVRWRKDVRLLQPLFGLSRDVLTDGGDDSLGRHQNGPIDFPGIHLLEDEGGLRNFKPYVIC